MSTKGEIIIKVYIDNKCFEIDCDTGIQDITWLALSACYLYGQETFPITTYVPIMVKNLSNKILHPRLVILQNKELIGDEVRVKVRRKFGTIGSEMTKEEEDWYNDAFLEGRFMLQYDIILRPVNEIKKENKFKIEFGFEIEPHVRTFFPYFKDIVICELNESERKGEFIGKMKIPFGKLNVNKIIYCEKISDAWDKETNDLIKNDVTLKKFPEILSHLEKEEYLRKKEDHIRAKENKIKQDITNAEKQKREEEIRQLQLKEYMSKIPFSLNEIYEYTLSEEPIEEQELLEIFELLERNDYTIFRKLFEIFNDYCKFYENDKALSIDVIAVSNFLTTYFETRENLTELPDEFQREYIARFEKDINEIDFKEFVFILIFLLNSILNHKDIKITEEIESILYAHEQKMKNSAFKELYKNDLINQIVNDNHLLLRKAFEKFGSKGKYEMYEMSGSQLFSFASELSTINKFNLGKLTEGETDLKKTLDFFEFLRVIIAMALNLIQPDTQSKKEPEENTEIEEITPDKAVVNLIEAIKNIVDK